MNTLSGILTERHLQRTTPVGRLMDFGKDFYAAQIYNNDLQAQLEAENNSVTVQNLTAYSLKSIWR